jgi:methionyl aminopeptidase
MNLTGHGVGRDIHESPDHIFNYKNTWDDVVLKEGMVIAFEPFISTEEEEVYQKNDGWTLAVEESAVAQIEHTIIVSKEGPILVTGSN